MNCKYFQNLLIQLSYHELNEEKIGLLENHLKICENCRAELKENEQLKVFSKILSKSVPNDKNQQESIRHILKEVDNSLSRPVAIGNIEETNVKNNFIYRTFRIAINVAAVFLMGLFVFQQIEIKRDLENMHTKIDAQGIMNIQKKLPINMNEFISLSDDQVEVLIQEYDELLKENSAILTYLKINYPEIYREIQQRKSIESNPIQNL